MNTWSEMVSHSNTPQLRPEAWITAATFHPSQIRTSAEAGSPDITTSPVRSRLAFAGWTLGSAGLSP